MEVKVRSGEMHFTKLDLITQKIEAKMEEFGDYDKRVVTALSHLTELQNSMNKRFEKMESKLDSTLTKFDVKIDSLKYLETLVSKNT